MIFPLSLEEEDNNDGSCKIDVVNNCKEVHIVQVKTCPIERLYKRFAAITPLTKKTVSFDPSEPEYIVIGFKKGPWSYNFDEEQDGDDKL